MPQVLSISARLTPAEHDLLKCTIRASEACRGWALVPPFGPYQVAPWPPTVTFGPLISSSASQFPLRQAPG